MPGQDYLSFIQDVARDPFPHLQEAARAGRRLVGYLCCYVPEELLYAAGLQPVRLMGRASCFSRADRHLQSYSCSHVRGFLEDWLEGRYPPLEGVLFAHTCDTLQGFYDIFKRQNPDLLVMNLNFPSQLSGEPAWRFARVELERFQAGLERHLGHPIAPEALSQAVAIYNQNRRLLARLYDLHAQNPQAFSSSVLLDSVLASCFCDKQEVNTRLEAFLEAQERVVSAVPPGEGPARVLLVGSVNISPSLHTLLESYGASVVDDLMCTGRRYFEGQIQGSSLDEVLRHYFYRPHCPAKHLTNTSRADNLVRLAQKRQARGVVFLHLKFCDPHAFDYPYLRERLEKEGVKTLLVEMEQTLGGPGQLATRVQAFVETLQNG